MSELKIEVLKREVAGKGANRRLRAAGAIPAVVYGGELDSVPIQVDRKSLHELFRSGAGENTVFQLTLAGAKESRPAMIRQMDVDPISRQILHIDFLRVDLSETIRVEVPVELIGGEPIGVAQEGGVLDFVTREVEVECLPGNIPHSLEVDVSGLHVGMHVDAGQLTLPDGVELLEDAERVIVSLSHSKVAAEVEELEGEAEAEELLEAEREEPEVIGKGKETEEEPAD